MYSKNFDLLSVLAAALILIGHFQKSVLTVFAAGILLIFARGTLKVSGSTPKARKEVAYIRQRKRS